MAAGFLGPLGSKMLNNGLYDFETLSEEDDGDLHMSQDHQSSNVANSMLLLLSLVKKNADAR